jgi:hypothetical protein
MQNAGANDKEKHDKYANKVVLALLVDEGAQIKHLNLYGEFIKYQRAVH